MTATAHTPEPSDGDQLELRKAFADLVNMPPAKLRSWLASDTSRSVGMTPGGSKVTDGADGESVGHHMGERILDIRSIPAADLKDGDFADMRKVVGYIRRHSAQRPNGDVSDTRWRHSLMNWGHDPLG